LKLKARLWIFAGILSTLATAGLFAAGDITGTVKDRSGGALVGADVNVLSPQLAAVASTKTDKDGKFRVTGLADGQYLLIVKFAGLAERHVTAKVGADAPALEIVLDVAALGEDVTVTANPGGLGDINRLTQPVNVISADDVLIRARTIVAQAVEGETGVNLQRTSPGMAGIFVRGLTGNKGERLCRRRALLERRAAWRRQHLPRSHRSVDARGSGSSSGNGERAVRQ
jgi:hypothetical protein